MIFFTFGTAPSNSDFLGIFCRIQRNIIAEVNTEYRTYFLYSLLKSMDTLSLLRSQKFFDQVEPCHEA